MKHSCFDRLPYHTVELEHEVLQKLATGLTYKEIADQLGINILTVRFHINKIYGKLHVHSRAEAMLKYLSE